MDMESLQVQQETALRYLRGELSEQESQAFEIWLLDKPDVVEQLALDQMMIQALPAQGRRAKPFISLGKLFSTPIRASLVTLACCLLVGVLSWHAMTPTQFADVNIFYLEQTRSQSTAANHIQIHAGQSLLVLSVQPVSPDSAYQVELKAMATQSTVAQFEHLAPQPDSGELTLSVPVSRLKAGEYKLLLTPDAHQQPQVFDLILSRVE
ncbi:hypothetical protein [Bowmanella denitrificans]|uniref:hypothetical protein n=1 Tax=Bowmanella denitrificans TaxID=366582 RepID=UPI000C9C4B56|nr:hypothetical protein [Bowmanella denitrificans]